MNDSCFIIFRLFYTAYYFQVYFSFYHDQKYLEYNTDIFIYSEYELYMYSILYPSYFIFYYHITFNQSILHILLRNHLLYFNNAKLCLKKF